MLYRVYIRSLHNYMIVINVNSLHIVAPHYIYKRVYWIIGCNKVIIQGSYNNVNRYIGDIVIL